MRRFTTRALVVAAATMGIVFAQVAPASATVHEIVAQWCSGKEPLFPPGLSGRSQADNDAKPLFASGYATIVPFTGSAGPGSLIDFNDDNPNTKVVTTGEIVVLDPSIPLYIEQIEPNPDFPAFQRCPNSPTAD